MTKRLMTLKQARERGLTSYDPKPYEHKQTFTFPWPPSINRLYYTDPKTGTRHISDHGHTFTQAVMEQIALFGGKAYYGARVGVLVGCHEPAGAVRIRDIQNIEKVLFDALGKAGLYDDDQQVDDFRFYRAERSKLKAGHIEVAIWPTAKYKVQWTLEEK